MQLTPPSIAPAASEPQRPVVLTAASGEAIDAAAFDARRLSLIPLTDSDRRDDVKIELRIRQARAIVFGENDDDFALLEKHAKSVLAQGLRLICIARSDESLKRFLALRDRLRGAAGAASHSHWWYWTRGTSVVDVAHSASEWLPGPTENPDLKITVFDRNSDECPPGKLLDWEDQLLLRRGFSDCVEVRLRQMAEGNSGRTFRVDALMQQLPPYNAPLPFIAKLDSVKKIVIEYQKYWELIDPSVPFHLRPRFDSSRSLTGYARGILVGSFVTDSDPFLEAIAHGSPQQLVYSLYDFAFAGWHSQLSLQKPEEANLAEHLDGEFRLDFRRFQIERAEEARSSGSTKTPDELLAALKRLPPTVFKMTPAHGDLHGGNLRARRGDTILIDFYSARRRVASCFDAAWLEVSTAFSTKAAKCRGWQAFIADIYALRALMRVPGPTAADQLGWLGRFVRQIRLFTTANQESPNEYAIVVAFCLLRFGTFCPRADDSAGQRVEAYLMAEKLIDELTK
jgi:hypothetical protein